MFKLLSIDAEFNQTQEPRVNPVSVSFRPYSIKSEKGIDSGRIIADGISQRIWLHNDKDWQEEARATIEEYCKKGYTILSFGGIAESRFLSAIGMDDPTSFKLFDLHILFRQLNHTWHKYKYGRYPKNGRIHTSTPPKFKGENLLPGNYNRIESSLSACAAHCLGQVIDSDRKDRIRNLIISNPPSFTEKQKEEILEYNESDIVFLPQLFTIMMDDFCKITGFTWEKAFSVMTYHGEYVKAIAAQEDEGIPVWVDRLKNISKNYRVICNFAIEECNKTFPFFIKDKKGKWVNSERQFAKYINDNGLAKAWPKTESGKFAKDEDTLDQYMYGDSKNALVAYANTMRTIRDITHFSENSKGKMMGNLGSDGRIRTWLAPFGTLSGRNAPKPSKGFIPAMARWTRTLINPPEGHVIIEYDWSSQEFCIAACLSGDRNMIEAYKSGDPYSFFAKLVGAMPPDGNKKTHPEIRDLFKGTVLAVQFNMSHDSLSLKLSTDTGRAVSVDEAKQLIQYHKRAFPNYWRWVWKIKEQYKCDGILILRDGWCLLPDNANLRSASNFPVQGTAGCIFRNASIRCHGKGYPVIYGLHDALRICVPKEYEAEASAALKEAMSTAVSKFLTETIRNDKKVIEHGIPYIEGAQAAEMYEKMLPFMEHTILENNSEESIDFLSELN